MTEKTFEIPQLMVVGNRSKKSGKLYVALVANLGYRDVVLTFNKYAIAEFLGKPFSSIINFLNDVQISLDRDNCGIELDVYEFVEQY